MADPTVGRGMVACGRCRKVHYRGTDCCIHGKEEEETTTAKIDVSMKSGNKRKTRRISSPSHTSPKVSSISTNYAFSGFGDLTAQLGYFTIKGAFQTLIGELGVTGSGRDPPPQPQSSSQNEEKLNSEKRSKTNPSDKTSSDTISHILHQVYKTVPQKSGVSINAEDEAIVHEYCEILLAQDSSDGDINNGSIYSEGEDSSAVDDNNNLQIMSVNDHCMISNRNPMLQSVCSSSSMMEILCNATTAAGCYSPTTANKHPKKFSDDAEQKENEHVLEDKRNEEDDIKEYVFSAVTDHRENNYLEEACEECVSGGSCGLDSDYLDVATEDEQQPPSTLLLMPENSLFSSIHDSSIVLSPLRRPGTKDISIENREKTTIGGSDLNDKAVIASNLLKETSDITENWGTAESCTNAQTDGVKAKSQKMQDSKVPPPAAAAISRPREEENQGHYTSTFTWKPVEIHIEADEIDIEWAESSVNGKAGTSSASSVQPNEDHSQHTRGRSADTLTSTDENASFTTDILDYSGTTSLSTASQGLPAYFPFFSNNLYFASSSADFSSDEQFVSPSASSCTGTHSSRLESSSFPSPRTVSDTNDISENGYSGSEARNQASFLTMSSSASGSLAAPPSSPFYDKMRKAQQHVEPESNLQSPGKCHYESRSNVHTRAANIVDITPIQATDARTEDGDDMMRIPKSSNNALHTVLESESVEPTFVTKESSSSSCPLKSDISIVHNSVAQSPYSSTSKDEGQDEENQADPVLQLLKSTNPRSNDEFTVSTNATSTHTIAINDTNCQNNKEEDNGSETSESKILLDGSGSSCSSYESNIFVEDLNYEQTTATPSIPSYELLSSQVAAKNVDLSQPVPMNGRIKPIELKVQRKEQPIISALIRKVRSYDVQIIAQKTRNQLLRTATSLDRQLSTNLDDRQEKPKGSQQRLPFNRSDRQLSPSENSLITMFSSSSSSSSSASLKQDSQSVKTASANDQLRATIPIQKSKFESQFAPSGLSSSSSSSCGYFSDTSQSWEADTELGQQDSCTSPEAILTDKMTNASTDRQLNVSQDVRNHASHSIETISNHKEESKQENKNDAMPDTSDDLDLSASTVSPNHQETVNEEHSDDTLPDTSDELDLSAPIGTNLLEDQATMKQEEHNDYAREEGGTQEHDQIEKKPSKGKQRVEIYEASDEFDLKLATTSGSFSGCGLATAETNDRSIDGTRKAINPPGRTLTIDSEESSGLLLEHSDDNNSGVSFHSQTETSNTNEGGETRNRRSSLFQQIVSILSSNGKKSPLDALREPLLPQHNEYIQREEHNNDDNDYDDAAAQLGLSSSTDHDGDPDLEQGEVTTNQEMTMGQNENICSRIIQKCCNCKFLRNLLGVLLVVTVALSAGLVFDLC